MYIQKILGYILSCHPIQALTGFYFILFYLNKKNSTNTLGKGMNPIILPPAMGK